jgi:peptidoglycan hydrolase-like protein with peptidoglycan-binding domain
MADAVRAFQKAKGLPVTGEVDENTQAALVAAHGS